MQGPCQYSSSQIPPTTTFAHPSIPAIFKGLAADVHFDFEKVHLSEDKLVLFSVKFRQYEARQLRFSNAFTIYIESLTRLLPLVYLGLRHST